MNGGLLCLLLAEIYRPPICRDSEEQHGETQANFSCPSG